MLVLSCLTANAAKQLKCLLQFQKLASSRAQGTRVTQTAILKKYYETLGVSEDCEDETLRVAFVHLAKQFHPDSGTKTADATKFSEIENAYRSIQKERSIQRERDTNLPPDVEEFDIQHTAPQHRHFLQYNTGSGTPTARQRRYTAERAQKAVENVMEHRLKKIQAAERNTLVGMDKSKAKDVKTRYGIDRLVEDLIQEAMNKGEFRDLPGAGKPLKDNSSMQNPYVDFATHKLNQVLIDNGFTPEWIQLSKEIREDTKDLEIRLEKARDRLGSVPLCPEDSESWQDTLEHLENIVKRINKNIDKYNLLVPILQKQMLRLDLKVLAKKALATPKRIDKNENRMQIKAANNSVQHEAGNFLDVLFFTFYGSKNK